MFRIAGGGTRRDDGLAPVLFHRIRREALPASRGALPTISKLSEEDIAMIYPATWRRNLPRLSPLLLMLGSVVILLETPSGESRAADSPVEAIAKKIAWQMEARKSVELRMQTDIATANPRPPVAGSFDSWKEHYIEMAGKRRCDFVYTSAGKVVRREEHFWNGSKAAAVSFAPGPDQKFDVPDTVTVKRNYFKEDAGERMERPKPILFLHVGHEPLHKALLKAKPMGTGTVLGRECDLFLFEQVRWRVPQDQLYHLDRETGLPLRVEGYPKYAERDEHKQHSLWQAESLDRVGKFYVPLKSVSIHFDQEGQPIYTWTSTVQSVDFDKDFPPATFWPADAPGAKVIDTIKKQVTQGEQSKDRQNLVGGPSSMHAAQTAHLPFSWTDGVAKVSMGMGALLVVVGLAVGWRRRGHQTNKVMHLREAR